MKRIILAIAAGLVLAAGCGHKEEVATYKTPQGEVTVKPDGTSNVTVSGSQGQASFTAKDGNVTGTSTDAAGKTSTATIGSQVDLSQLGVRLYPGSTPKEGTSIRTDTPEGVSTGVQLLTSDDTSKIVDFYKSELKANSSMITPTGGLVSGTTSAGDKALVTISKADAGNNIGIMVVKKK